MMKSHNATVPLTSCRVLSNVCGLAGAGASDDEDDNVELFAVNDEKRDGNVNGSATLCTLPLADNDLSDELAATLCASCFSTLKYNNSALL